MQAQKIVQINELQIHERPKLHNIRNHEMYFLIDVIFPNYAIYCSLTRMPTARTIMIAAMITKNAMLMMMMMMTIMVKMTMLPENELVQLQNAN